MSQYQWAKDKLKQFDMDCQNIREEIDRLYAQLAKKQEARLQFQGMVEAEFGEPQTVVMQRMDPGFIDRRVSEAQQIGRERREEARQIAHKGDGRPYLDDPTLPPLGTPERKRELDRRKYYRKQEAKKKERSQRPDAGKQRNTPQARAANHAIRERIRNEMEHRTEPVSASDLIRAWGVTDELGKGRVYQGVSRLAERGELKYMGPGEHGYTYLATHKANDHEVSP